MIFYRVSFGSTSNKCYTETSNQITSFEKQLVVKNNKETGRSVIMAFPKSYLKTCMKPVSGLSLRK